MTKTTRKEHYDPQHIKHGQKGWGTQRRSDASILNARGSRWTQAQLDRIREFYAAHENKPMRLQDLADELNTRKSTLSRMARWLGVARRGRVHPYDVRRVIGEKQKRIIAEKGHPRGALGMRHSEETKRKMSERLLALSAMGMLHIQRNGMTDKQREVMGTAMRKRLMTTPNAVYSRAKRGYRDDLGDTFFRSSWEANYARYLNWMRDGGLIKEWSFEPETFWFNGIKRGVVSYLPDFKVINTDDTVYYVEVKGWMDAKSKTKIKRMAKYYPSVKLVVVDAKAYRQISKTVAPFIKGWE